MIENTETNYFLTENDELCWTSGDLVDGVTQITKEKYFNERGKRLLIRTNKWKKDAEKSRSESKKQTVDSRKQE